MNRHRSQKFLGVLALLTLVLTMLPIAAAQGPTPQDRTPLEGASSPEVTFPAGESRINQLSILLIQTTDTTQSVQRALNELGYTYDIFNGSDWTGIDFTPYDMVLVGMDGGLIDQPSVQKIRTDVIDQGKRAFFLGGTCYQNWALGVNQYIVLNNTSDYCWAISSQPHFTIVDPSHPLAQGLPSPYNFINSSAAYYAIRVTDPDIDQVAQNGDGYDSFFYKNTNFPGGGNPAGDFCWFIDSVYTSYWTNQADFDVLKQIVNNCLTYTPGGLGHLDGQVDDASSGNPIEGATVTAYHEAGSSWDALTDPSGYYTMTVLNGTFTVTVEHPQYTTAITTGIEVITDVVTTVDFQLVPRGRLFGYVTDWDNGFPLEGATVTADDGTTADTNASGYYEMYLDEGTHVVTATAQDYAPEEATVVITSGLDTQQDFALQAAVVFIPSPLHVTVPWQSTYNTGATLTNRLLTPYDFEFQEKPGGFIPMIESLPPNTQAPAAAPTGPAVQPQNAPLSTGAAPAGYVPQPAPVLTGLEGIWEARAPSPFVSMDNVYVDYDGKGYLVGGYGAGGQVGIYDPTTDSWTTGATEPAPQIAYPVDGCFGFNASGDPMVIIFNDATSGATTWHRYNINSNTWDTVPVPAGFPANGLWATDITSLWRWTGQNVCYISGGATAPGGGNVSSLYEYHPDTNTVVNLGNFTLHPAGFDFHASWYVPWVGSAGAICVGGGTDAASVVFPDTQCYDIAASAFNAPNADLGSMLQGVWGTADGVLYENGDYQLWVANGADAGFNLWQQSMYYSHNDGQWHYGPNPLYGVYRVEGENVPGDPGCDFYAVTGSTGGFTPSNYNERNVSPECPPTAGVDVPWFGQVPVSGTVPAQSSFNPTMLFTATTAVGVDQPGDYYCDLIVSGAPKVTVRVTMTVVPGADMGQVHGYVLDNCTGDPVEATIDILNGDPITQTQSDKDTGYYSAWLISGTYDLVFSAAGYLSYSPTVSVVGGGEVVLDVNLVPDRPCIALNPDSFEVWVLTGTAVYTHSTGMDITNGGGQDLDYVIHEISGTPSVALVTLPAGPTTASAGTATAGGAYTPAPAITYEIIRHAAPEAAPDVLLVCADDNPCEPIRTQLLAFGDLGAIDVFDARSATPTLPQLQNYDVVLVWSNYVFADPTGMGNVLADYVDAGGRVIDLMFSMGTHGWQMQGRFMSQNYTAVNGTSILYANSCLGTYDPNHPIMNGVTDVCEVYRLAGTYLTPGSTAIAMWQDGTIFVGAKDDRTVVSITGYVGAARQWTGQMDLVVHNAILWLAQEPYTDVPWIWEEPVSGTVPSETTANVGLYFSALYTDGTPMPLGTYTATLVVENNDPVARTQNVPAVMHIIEQAVPPTATFSSNSPVCLGEEMVFTNTTIPGIPPTTWYEWDFGDGITSTLENPTHLYTAAGTYTVTLTAFNEYISDTYSMVVEVLPLPAAGFTYAVDELTVTFTNTSTAATDYLWDFGDSTTSTETNPIHTYAAEGTYTVTLSASGSCGTDEFTDWVTVGLAPVAGFTSNSPVCLGAEMVFTNTTTGTPEITYLWAFGDGATSTETNPVHPYTATGSYTVTLMADNAFGSSEVAATVEVLPLPQAIFTYTAAGLTVTFTNSSTGATSYLWAFGDTTTSTETNPVHTYTAAGTYTVTLTVTGACGTDEASTVLTFAPLRYYIYLPLVIKGAP
jgi:PKD repeat protein